MMRVPDINICNVPGPSLSASQLTQIEAIFFDASGRSYPPGTERDAFRERWLGRYLKGGTDVALLALSGCDCVVGYLVGALDNPAEQARFADIDCLNTDFAECCRRFPAHLHINLAPEFRGKGLGARLIEAFAAHAAGAGAAGMHVITGEGMRNVGFYERCRFSRQAHAVWNGRKVLFLGRKLNAP